MIIYSAVPGGGALPSPRRSSGHAQRGSGGMAQCLVSGGCWQRPGDGGRPQNFTCDSAEKHIFGHLKFGVRPHFLNHEVYLSDCLMLDVSFHDKQPGLKVKY